MSARRTSADPQIVARLRMMCMALPEVVEEQAWVGTRWVIRKHNFAHVLAIESGWPPAYAKALGFDGPATVLTFRSSGAELHALANAGPPFFKPVWWPDIVGMRFDGECDPVMDWTEVAELLTESYCLLAPKKLTALSGAPPMGRPTSGRRDADQSLWPELSPPGPDRGAERRS